MKMHRVKITSWTASFRYPNLISGYQPSLPVPPISTVLGLISAAAGFDVGCLKPQPGYFFKSAAKTLDVETIYQFKNKDSRGEKVATLRAQSNIVQREILFDNCLWLYLTEQRLAEYFVCPHFPILLGRSQDLAQIEEVREIEVQPKDKLQFLRGTTVPFREARIPGLLQALPHHFSANFPRENIAVEPYCIIDTDYRRRQPLDINGYYDPELNVDIYCHSWKDASEK